MHHDCALLWLKGVHQHSFCIWLEELLHLLKVLTHSSIKASGM